MSVLMLTTVLAVAAGPEFACMIGRNQLEIVQHGDRLTYRYGPPGRPAIALTGGPGGGVFYHRALNSRGEDQTLRFLNGDWHYVVYHRWQAPGGTGPDGMHTTPEYVGAGVLVLKHGRVVRRLRCTGGDLLGWYEWPIFARLPVDPQNRTPDDA